MELRQRVEEKLRRELAATHVEVRDESHLHAGHGAPGAHLRAIVVSPRFAGLGRVAAQRLVYAVLADELRGEIHALALEARAPGPARA
jgi:BolA protein